MSANTTSTLIEVVNRVLLDVGERQVTTFTPVAARKALAYVKDAFVSIQNFHDWEWLRAVKTPDSWLVDEAVITDSRRIRRVTYQTSASDVSYHEVPATDGVSYDHYGLQSFSSTDNVGSRPMRYTIVDEQTIKMNPYPTDTSTQNRVIVHYVAHLNPPVGTSDVFQMPERFVPTLLKFAVSMMYTRHLGDFNASQSLQQEFLSDLTGFRARENSSPTTGTNMFRTPRVTHYSS